MMSNANKKKWSKKKKVTVIVLSVILTLIFLVVIAGVAALNWYCATADYEVLSTDKNVTLIAHRGMRSVAPENTAPAFEEAGKHGYWGAECDIYRTADGVWIVSHDSHTYRMMDKSAFIEKKTYDELMTMKVDNGVNIDQYTDLSFCTLEEYLQICKDYGMVAVIELKGENNTEYYNEITELVDKYDIEAVYISFHIENIKKLSELTDDKLYFLTKEITQEDIDLAKSIKNCGIDFDGNNEKNFENGMIQKCIDEGLEVGAWTIDETEVLDKLYDAGVTLITTDNITK